MDRDLESNDCNQSASSFISDIASSTRNIQPKVTIMDQAKESMSQSKKASPKAEPVRYDEIPFY